MDALVLETAGRVLLNRVDFPVTIAAVGGYGRRELFPHSDIDLLILVEDEPQLLRVKDPVSEFIRELWDAQLKVSQSVRPLAECCRLNDQNIELHISLLDLRFLCGDRVLFDKLQPHLADFYKHNAARLMRRLCEMTRQRHYKFQGTVYHLEPNVKEGPGGIRDIQLLHWLSALAPNREPLTLALEETADPKRFLYSVRTFLHEASGRDNNLLSFEMQDQAARSLAELPVPPEQWMREYYRHARCVFQRSLRAVEFAESQDSSLMRQFRDWRSRLSTADFTISHERIFLRNPAGTLSSVDSVFGLFVFVARHGILLSWDAQRKVQAAIPQLEAALRAAPPRYTLWRELMSQPHAAAGLRQMQETGFLAIALPCWHAIESLVVRDFYHRYTVDEHSLVAIEAIDSLYDAKSGAPPRFCQLASECETGWLLRLALLLHDVGKGITPGDHIRGSLEAADEFLPWLSMPAEDRETIHFLIEHHLDLSSVMNGRDLNDPATARFLTGRLGTQENLKALVLFTYADISAVNPTALTPWRAEQLWRVYTLTEEQLTRELTSERIQSAAAIEGWVRPGFAANSSQLDRFLEGFPTRYLRIHTREQIEHHFELEQRRRRDGVAVEITREPGAYRLCVVAADQPGLFASICGALASYGMDILKAEASSNSSGCILDEIRFADPIRTLELNSGETARLEWTIECVLKGVIQVPDLLKRRRAASRPKAAPKITPRIRFDNSASDSSTLIEFVAEDRPGLLYDLASALSHAECNIELVLVDTEAHKAIDVFYVTCHGDKLDVATRDELFKALEFAAAPTV
ncbi:MAG: hypothetical protein JO138_27520 [Acidobacteriaceae bacterium]|nr:hypothetical protein [Acidobacteriaceae bacterium]